MKKQSLLFMLICSALIYVGCSKVEIPDDNKPIPVRRLDYSSKNMRKVLLEMYAATDGENWTKQPNWEEEDDPENWDFFSYEYDGRCSFTMIENGAKGTIPASFFDLPFDYIWLDDNELTGELPDNVGNNGLLKELHLSNNQITGTIPVSFANSSDLAADLAYNKMSGKIPEEVRKMVYFHDFLLIQQDGYGFEEVEPTEPIAEEVNILTEMYEKFPKSVQNNLNWQNAEPQNFNHVTWNTEGHCVMLDLSGMEHLALGKELNQLKGLQILNCNNTQLDSFPDTLSLPDLVHLNLSVTEIKHFPDLSALKKLQVLELINCDLKTEIPAFLDELTQLTELHLEYNGFYGTIPDLSHLVHLSYLNLENSYGSLTPQPFPQWVTENTTLKYCNLAQCNLTGEIPEKVGHMSAVHELILTSNHLSGTIEKLFVESSDMNFLRILCIDNNKFTGNLPEFHKNIHLKEIYLNDCAFSGTLPVNWRHLKSLYYVRADHNELTGTLPTWLMDLPHVKLSLKDNMMAGHYSSELTQHPHYNDWEVSEQRNGTLSPEPEN